jgi:hypothetical protein
MRSHELYNVPRVGQGSWPELRNRIIWKPILNKAGECGLDASGSGQVTILRLHRGRGTCRQDERLSDCQGGFAGLWSVSVTNGITVNKTVTTRALRIPRQFQYTEWFQVVETPKTGSVVRTLLILPVPLQLVSRYDTDSCNTEPSRASKSDTEIFRNVCWIWFQQYLVAYVNFCKLVFRKFGYT